MSGRVAKRLRREAEAATIGEPPYKTKRYYKTLKKYYKLTKGA